MQSGSNDKALEYLYIKIYPKIKTYIFKNSGTEDDAFDIFQDSIIILCKQVQLDKFDTKKEISGFLFSVCRNLWINKAKRDKKTTRLTEDFDYKDSSDFSNDIITNAKASGLKQITNMLGEKCYELLKSIIIYNKTPSEIIEQMGFATINSVKTQKYKCKQKLFKILEENPSLNDIIE